MDHAADMLALLQNAMRLADEAGEPLLAAQIALPVELLEHRLFDDSRSGTDGGAVVRTKDEVFGTLIRKLGRLSALDDVDRCAISELPFRVATMPPGADLVREGERITQCCLLIEGYAFRYKVTANGGRQIVSFHLAGDVLDVQHLLLARADHSLQTLSDATVAWLPVTAVTALAEDRPRVGEALWRDSLIDASVFREWVLNVGRRDAKSRIAHMLCEFAVRREAAGLGTPERFDLPMSPAHIADATGLAPVQVNRMMKALTDDGLLERNGRELKIADWDRMRRVADFDVDYLHLAA